MFRDSWWIQRLGHIICTKESTRWVLTMVDSSEITVKRWSLYVLRDITKTRLVPFPYFIKWVLFCFVFIGQTWIIFFVWFWLVQRVWMWSWSKWWELTIEGVLDPSLTLHSWRERNRMDPLLSIKPKVWLLLTENSIPSSVDRLLRQCRKIKTN